MSGFRTKAIHSGQEPEKITGAVAPVTVFQNLYVPELVWMPHGTIETPPMVCGPVVYSDTSCAFVSDVTAAPPLAR